MALAGVAVLAAATAGFARAGTTLIVTGHGWGHGVGMSQWGAYGYARHGWDYKRILLHYYPGTKLTTDRTEPNVRVLLEQGARTVTVGCARRIAVTNGHQTWHLPPKTYGVSARLALPVGHRPGHRPFTRYALFSCAHATLTLGGRPYHGTLSLRSNGSSLEVINEVVLDNYVRGVVPAESPSRWPLAELEAQAVAARSYAVAQLKPSALYDLVPDTRDQVYAGMAAERPRSNDAVEKTRGQILTYHGAVARTYYSSSSGGRTEAAADAWPGAAPIPYLRSVADPYDTYSPNHNWGPFAYSGSRLGAALGVGGTVKSVVVRRDSSERVSDVVLRLTSGKAVVVGGETVTRALGLKSTWFSVGELSVTASSSAVLYGRSVRVVAQAIGAKGAVLQEERSNGAWRTLSRVQGRATISVEPLARTAFRLRIPGVSGDAVGVAVRPQLRVRAVGPRLLAGAVLPRRAGPVAVWRLQRGAWKVVSRPKLLPDGSFRTPLRLRAATYRITAGAGAFAPAQKQLVVTRRMLASFAR
jgi:stage II sporulation protein D